MSERKKAPKIMSAALKGAGVDLRSASDLDWGETQPETQPIAARAEAKAVAKAEKLVQDGDTYLLNIRSLSITTQEEYVVVIDKLKEARGVRAGINAEFDELITTANKAHKAALALKKKVDTPWAAADTILTKLSNDWNLERERARLANEERIRQENERRILAAGEEERLRIATELSERGDLDGAAEAMDQPIAVPMMSVKVESTVPKMDGVSNRKNYHAQVVNRRQLLMSVLAGTTPWEAITENMTFLNAQARTFKREGEIYPGVVGVMEIGTAVTLP